MQFSFHYYSEFLVFNFIISCSLLSLNSSVFQKRIVKVLKCNWDQEAVALFRTLRGCQETNAASLRNPFFNFLSIWDIVFHILFSKRKICGTSSRFWRDRKESANFQQRNKLMYKKVFGRGGAWKKERKKFAKSCHSSAMPLVLIFIAEFVPVSPLLMLVSAALKLQACQEGPKRVTKEIHLLERKKGRLCVHKRKRGGPEELTMSKLHFLLLLLICFHFTAASSLKKHFCSRKLQWFWSWQSNSEIYFLLFSTLNAL